MRWIFCLALVGVLAGCGPDDGLPPSVPTVTGDGGVDLGATDAGVGFTDACADAGCPNLDTCEPLSDAGVSCGSICGNACGTLCAESRCHDLDAGTWGKSYCANPGDSAKAWSRSVACDDGNPCTDQDTCDNGACLSKFSPSTTACDDDDVCTTGDHCNGSGTCIGTEVTADLIDRYYHDGSGVTVTNYAYGPHANASWWTGVGYSDEASIYTSVPAPSGQTLHECWLQSGSYDRILLFDTSAPSGYTCSCSDSNCDTGLGASTHLPGTVALHHFVISAGHAACGGLTPCNYYTTDTGAGPAGGTEQSTTIWVCPPP